MLELINTRDLKLFSSILVLLIICFACNSDPAYPEIPEINLESVKVYKNRLGKDSMIILNIKYTDGDGDLGLDENDTMPPFNFGNIGFYNLTIGYEAKKDNNWQKIIIPLSSDTIQFNQRFVRLNKTNKTKTILGNMEVRIPASPYPGIKPDTIRLICRMSDRKLHYSKTVISSEINLKH